MSYLDALIRAGKSPVTDLHLWMLHYPAQRDKSYNFFTGEPIADIWSRMQAFETQLSNFERKYSVSSEAIYQRHTEGEKLENSEVVGHDFNEWARTYHLWLTCRRDYCNKFEEFRREAIDAEEIIVSSPMKENLGGDANLVSKNRIAIELLQAWREGDKSEQQETWDYLKQALEEDRLSNRKLFK